MTLVFMLFHFFCRTHETSHRHFEHPISQLWRWLVNIHHHMFKLQTCSWQFNVISNGMLPPRVQNCGTFPSIKLNSCCQHAKQYPTINEENWCYRCRECWHSLPKHSSNKIDWAKNKTTLIEHRQNHLYEIMCIPIHKVYSNIVSTLFMDFINITSNHHIECSIWYLLFSLLWTIIQFKYISSSFRKYQVER